MLVRTTLAAIACALGLALAIPGGAAAQEAAASVAEQLDDAFETLRTSKSERVAKRAERRIIRLWLESDSDTVDLLMSWALRAIDEENYATALDYLDRVILMMPDFAEGWNKRATVHFLRDDYVRALADLEQVLAREPRHFGAMSGLGIILRDIGETEQAISVFQAALEIDPLLDNVREALSELETERESDL